MESDQWDLGIHTAIVTKYYSLGGSQEYRVFSYTSGGDKSKGCQ